MKKDVKKKLQTLPAKPRSLAQEQSDFTAEGSPPPGKVAKAAPATPAAPKSQLLAPRTGRLAGRWPFSGSAQ